MADRDPTDLSRENTYLKLRNAQLQSDILDLSAEAERLRRLQDRLHGRTAVKGSDGPPAGLHYPRRELASQMSFEVPDVAQAAAAEVREAIATKEGLMSEYGIVQASIDYFHVGGYRYTSLDDAMAQAKKQRRIP